MSRADALEAMVVGVELVVVVLVGAVVSVVVAAVTGAVATAALATGAVAAVAVVVPAKRNPFGHEPKSRVCTPLRALAANACCAPTGCSVTRPPRVVVMSPACTAAVQIDESSV